MEMAEDTTCLELDDLRVGYGDLDIVKGVSLRVAQGEFLALLGANGAGNTTLLSAIAGLKRPRSGTIRLWGEEATGPGYRRARKGLAFIGDDRQLFPSLTVAQTMRLVRQPVADPREIVPELEPLWGRRVGLLSGGEQQMTALARALSAGPRLVVVDELSQGLAPVIRDRLLQHLRRAADRGTSVIVVEQGVDAVLRVADRGAVLRQGEIADVRDAADWQADEEGLVASYLS
jgi:branched-chain amino acid transport system ATP-binding protein